ncbi:MAG: stage III sporulation protein AD [Peptococcaceae bacterium]|nr:stage III sporulation protein AD [Peptococcaceae bacterium]
MEILPLVGITLAGAVLAVVLRQQRPELAMLLSLTIAVFIFLSVVGRIGAVVQVLRDLVERAGVSMFYLGTILKIVGIAYIADFGAQISRDAGEGAVAAKIEFAAKIMILVLAVPVVVAVLEAVLKLVP